MWHKRPKDLNPLCASHWLCRKLQPACIINMQKSSRSYSQLLLRIISLVQAQSNPEALPLLLEIQPKIELQEISPRISIKTLEWANRTILLSLFHWLQLVLRLVCMLLILLQSAVGSSAHITIIQIQIQRCFFNRQHINLTPLPYTIKPLRVHIMAYISVL